MGSAGRRRVRRRAEVEVKREEGREGWRRRRRGGEGGGGAACSG